MPNLRNTLLATAIYIGLVAFAALSLGPSGTGVGGVGRLLAALLPFQVAATALVVVIARRVGFSQCGFASVRWRGLAWMAPSWIVLIAMFVNIGQQTQPEDFAARVAPHLLLLLIVPLLIAIGEEVMFRGLLLRRALERIGPVPAMLLSAVLFGMMHLANGLTGAGMGGAAQQALFAFFVGLSLAPIALRLGNLWPLIIWHWLWNVGVFVSLALDVFHPLVGAGMAVQLVISGWLWRKAATLVR